TDPPVHGVSCGSSLLIASSTPRIPGPATRAPAELPCELPGGVLHPVRGLRVLTGGPPHGSTRLPEAGPLRTMETHVPRDAVEFRTGGESPRPGRPRADGGLRSGPRGRR